MKVLQSLSSQTLVSIPLLVPSFVVPLLQHVSHVPLPALVSPADGMVLHFDAVQGTLVEQLQGLLIPSTHFSASSGSDLNGLNRETEAHHHHDNNDSAVFCP
jgi:hypothetical protein